MNALMENALRQIQDFSSKLSRKDKLRLAVLGVLILAFSITLALVLGRVNYATLYSGLTNAEGGRIIAALDEMGVPYKAQGGAILVPAERASDLRMRLEAEGIQGGDLSTSFLERTLSFGVTSEDRAAFQLLQKQADMRATIMRMEKIDNCYVALTLPPDSMFVRPADKPPASAALFLEVRDGETLTQVEAHSIGAYVMGAVPGLLPENISIVDAKLNLYSITAEIAPPEENSLSDTALLDYQFALRDKTRQNIETQITNFLTPVFGEGHVRVAVSLSLNFDRESISSVVFAPPVEGETDGIVVSMQELYESTRYGAQAGGVPGTDTNGVNDLGTPEYPYLPLQGDQLYGKVLREMNYEINETRTELERAQGDISNLSIGVLLDSANVDGDYTDSVSSMVAQAVGVNSRYVSVQALPFQLSGSEAAKTLESQNDFMARMERLGLIRFGILAIALLLLALLVFSFIRTVLRAFAPPKPALAALGPGGAIDYISMEENILLPEATDLTLADLAAAEAEADELAVDELSELAELDELSELDELGEMGEIGETDGFSEMDEMSETHEFAEMEDMEMEGMEMGAEIETEPEIEIPVNVKSDTVEKLEKFIDRDPEAVAQLLRNWLSDDYR